ncbi:DUF488 domain-containing protein [Flavobacterium aquatile]|uniref:Uroporphyrin-III methyltransferase n=1 Tax=Flavobacterium aquatile LMG 4008 = ATCC 11947 TaxID=1453498 RepID=A0A095SRG5_9FLAO|nr:DUF488 family protein [Flavobacterium aquatile]KGD66954.1 hypothetical protein LG45_16160 [Flavobacterium aquatile LMG 4008 = ATCC 11947]OXA68047.1 hypothetical protein B0A61_06155 [Flavobacterium aquatile LMG 4008 = ATCC 11947]GEC80078.1 hypothetical protein FAQ01_29480 [Flavobacterium aquatile]
MSNITLKRIYDHKKPDDTYRILVDRVWPRGLKKSEIFLDEWNREVTPSVKIRKWFDHQESRFKEFTKLYTEELKQKEEELNRLRSIAKTKKVTLLYGAKDPQINHAVILRDVLTKLI